MNSSETTAGCCAIKAWFIPPIVIPAVILLTVVLHAVLRSYL